VADTLPAIHAVQVYLALWRQTRVAVKMFTKDPETLVPSNLATEIELSYSNPGMHDLRLVSLPKVFLCEVNFVWEGLE
jgi:hypothetical protein